MSEGPKRPVRVGVVGVGRGITFAQGAGPAVGLELVALCDVWEERLRAEAGRLGVAAYADYDAFLEHDLDAVVLANYFHQHAPLAVRALESDRHVMSETTAAFTLAECVELVRAVERSGKIYMLAENYPYAAYNQEMRRLYKAGEIGQFRYGEGEYVHPMSASIFNSISRGVDHWRNWLPVTYYCTHALAPVMFITDTWPVSVNGFVIPHDPADANKARTARRSDTASMIALNMDNGAVVKLLQYDLRGEGSWTRIHGNRGLMENLRHGGQHMLRVHKESFEKDDDEPVERIYDPDFPVHHDEASRAGHGGGDFFMTYHFAEAIRSGKQPYFDVLRGVAMSMVGILAYRSALAGAAPLSVPDLRVESERRLCENDDWSPDPAVRRAGQPAPSMLGAVEPTEEALSYAREVWSDKSGLLYGSGSLE